MSYRYEILTSATRRARDHERTPRDPSDHCSRSPRGPVSPAQALLTDAARSGWAVPAHRRRPPEVGDLPFRWGL